MKHIRLIYQSLFCKTTPYPYKAGPLANVRARLNVAGQLIAAMTANS